MNFGRGFANGSVCVCVCVFGQAGRQAGRVKGREIAGKAWVLDLVLDPDEREGRRE